MARHRTTRVRESQAELQALAEQFRGSAREARIRMLLAMHDDPRAPLHDLSPQLGRSVRQLQRWWSEYSRGGLDGLLASERPATKRRAKQEPQHAALRAESTVAPGAQVMRFINSMPTADDPDVWLAQFHARLKEILLGVDLLVLNVAQTASPLSIDTSTSMLSRQHGDNGLGGRRSALVGTFREGQTPGEMTVAQALERGISAAHYQKPHVVDYYVNGGGYVGTIVLWRERSAGSPIPASTIELLESLHGFIAFAFSDCQKRRVGFDPDLRHFHGAIERAAERINLRQRELEVFVLQLVGLRRREIAERLHITECAVAKRAASIYRKAGTRNLLELFTPL